MKRSFFLLFATLFGVYPVQSQILDDFSDGNLTAFPRWWGQPEHFGVADGQLQLQAPVTESSAFVFVPAVTNLAETTIWSCKIRMEFAPSASNYAIFFLQASLPNLEGNQEGYFLKIGGESGNADALELYRQDDADRTLLLRGTDGAAGSDPVAVSVEVRRSPQGEWTLLADYSGGENFQVEGTVQDATYPEGAYTGLVCRFTSTRRESFFFDDFKVSPTYPDTEAPGVLGVEARSATELDLLLSEPVLPEAALSAGNYQISGGIGQPAEVQFVENSFTRILLKLNQALADQNSYTLTVDALEDYAGNVAGPQSVTFSYLDVLSPAPGDLLINEILFNPQTGGSDFVELYNPSEKVLNLAGLQLINTQVSSSNRQKEIKGDLLLFPGQYLALTPDPADILDRYSVPDPERVAENDLPTLSDQEGNLSIRWNSLTLDSFDYREDFHFPLLAGKDGVSLERISPGAPTNDPGNWHSAASTVGFATPGYRNSQFVERTTLLDEMIRIPNKRLSPDGDGFEDVLLIEYQTPNPGYVLNVRIFDAQGRLVNHLIKNELLAASGTFNWDGFTNEFTKARIGIYVLWFELFDLSGKVEEKKEAVVVAGRI